MLSPTSEAIHRPSSFRYTVLMLPYGMTLGYVLVALAYSLSHAGIATDKVAAVVALLVLPQTWKALWAPLIDVTMSAMRWHRIASAVTGMLLIAIALLPAAQQHLQLISALVFACGTAGSFCQMSTENLMATHTTAADKGRAAGWSQAGILGGWGLGGGLALWTDQQLVSGSGGVLLGVMCFLCPLALRPMREATRPRTSPGDYIGRLVVLARDVWAIMRRRNGMLTFLLAFLPFGTGAAGTLWSALAGDWHASAKVVAAVNGLSGGLLSIMGCLLASYVCDRVDRKFAYCLFAIAQGVTAAAMAVAPRSVACFVLFTSLYAFLNGCIWAALAAVLLEAIGRRSPATSYNLFSCMANVPIAYMALFEGRTQSRLGSSVMLYAEAGLCGCGVLLFLIVVYVSRERGRLSRA